MKYSSITYPDINNGLGCRCSLWCSGCTHKCEGCHNKCTWDFNFGNEFTESSFNELVDILNREYIKGLTLTGGDPLDSFNDVLDILIKVKSILPKKDIWLYTGYEFNDIIKSDKKRILDYVDYLVDGQFDISKRNISLKFRGSSNQVIWEKDNDGNWIKSELNN